MEEGKLQHKRGCAEPAKISSNLDTRREFSMEDQGKHSGISKLKRGEVQRLTFVADKPGIFKIVYTIHTPSMQADLVVLKR